MVVDHRVEIALHDVLLVVPIVCACPAAWGIGNLHQTAAVEEEPCPSAVGNMSPGAVDLVEEEAFDRFRRPISVEVQCLTASSSATALANSFTSSDISPKAPTTGPSTLPPWP